MQRNIKTVFLIPYFQIPGACTSPIYVSTAGHDHIGCGRNLRSCCKTIDYTGNQIMENNDDLILVSASETQPTIFPINATLALNKNITVASQVGQRTQQPVIQSFHRNDIHLFNANGKHPIILNVTGIRFKNVGLIRGAFQHVSISGCQFDSTDNILNVTAELFDTTLLIESSMFANSSTVVNIDHRSIHHVDVSMKNSTSLHCGSVLSYKSSSERSGASHFSFRSSVFNGCYDRKGCISIQNENVEKEHGNVGNHNCTLLVEDCTIMKYMNVHGNGSITVNHCKNVEINKSIFKSNSGIEGAALYLRIGSPLGTVVIQNSSFERNTALRHGGAVIVFEVFLLNLTRCTFVQNVAKTGTGGAVIFANKYITGTAYVDSSVFVNNAADGRIGGAIYASGKSSSLFVSDSSFIRNRARLVGGAVSSWTNFSSVNYVLPISYSYRQNKYQRVPL